MPMYSDGRTTKCPTCGGVEWSARYREVGGNDVYRCLRCGVRALPALEPEATKARVPALADIRPMLGDPDEGGPRGKPQPRNQLTYYRPGGLRTDEY